MGAVSLLVVGAMACGDDKKSTFDPDAITGQDTATQTDTGQVDDTAQPGDTTQPTDTAQPTDTSPPATPRACTDAELATLDPCLDACAPGDEPCAQACLGSLSNQCQAAYLALAQCVAASGCAGNDVPCIVAACPAEVEAVFGSGPEPGDCDPVTNDGCDPGQNCTFVSESAVGCATAGGAGYGEDCTSDPCTRGACLTFDGVDFECAQFCSPMNNQCPDGRPCNQAVQGSDYLFCGNLPSGCSLWDQDCPNNQGCYVVDQQGSTDCAPHNNVQAGGSCSFVNDCAPGHICVGNPGSCAVLCNTDGSVACTTGTCTGIGVGTIGACVGGGS